MKQIQKKTWLLFFGLFVHCIGFTQMNYTNLEWVDRSPIVSDSVYHTSSIVVSGKLYVVTNKTNVSGNTDIYVLKIDSNGDTLWSATYNGTATGSMDYGVEIAYASSYIWVVGAAQNTSTGYDIVTLKYSVSTGSLAYSNVFNGAGGGDDFPSSLVAASNGAAVYVCGGSEATNGFSDMVAFKLNFGPGSAWTKYYDYAGLHDFGAKIVQVSTNMVVTGGSAAAVGDMDLATLTIHQLTGSMTTSRTNISGATIVEANAMTTDTLNNVYVTGYAIVSGEKQIQTYKFDSTLALVWIQNYVGDDHASGKDVGVDGSGNVYVTGYNEISSGVRNFITIKYNSAGSQQWVRQLGNTSGEEENAIAERISVTADGDMYLTGTVVGENGSGMKLVKYNSSGDIKLARDYQSDTVDYQAYDINVNENDVYITGLEKSIGMTRLTTLKYSVGERPMQAVVNGSSVETHINDEIIIAFHPDSIKHDVINRKETTFGRLDEFVEPGIIDAMTTKFPGVEWEKVETYKIFQGMTTNDTTSITRLGYEIPVPEFWAVLLLHVPGKNEFAIRDSFKLGMHPAIQHAELNHLYSLCTVDPHYTPYQLSLYPGTYPDGDIAMDHAWVHDYGNPDVKVGIYDTGLRFSHEDLEGYSGGWDYGLGAHISDSPNNGDVNGHGTKVAGVIGATRENGTGVAGIAGGNWPYAPATEVLQTDLEPGETRGVSLYGFKVVGVGLSATEMYNAILEGALYTTNGYGYGVHVINCSWRRNVEYTSEYDTVQTIWGNVHREVFKNQTTLVASRGNLNTTQAFFPAHANKEFWVISVGAANSIGKRYNTSGIGDSLDILAPGDSMMIYSTAHNADNGYGRIGQTSAAAAHTSGLVGLMLSHINDQPNTINNLAPDDVEFLIKRYAVDKHAVGYDDTSGYGFIDAGNVLHYIDRSVYVIKHHFVEEVFMFDNSNPDVHVNLLGPITATNWMYDDGIHGYGAYTGTEYNIGVQCYHTINPGDSIHNFWPLNSYTNLYTDYWGGIAPYLTSFENESFMNAAWLNEDSAYVEGHIMHFTEAPDGTPIDVWYPVAPGGIIKVGYTLHLESDYAGLEEPDKESDFSLVCYPNPTGNDLTLLFNLTENAYISCEILDLSGKVLQSSEFGNLTNGQHKVNFDVNTLASGVYVVKLKIGNEFQYAKFVKQ